MYIIISPMIACILYVLDVSIFTFVDLNGGICQFVLAYAIPVYIHVQCRYLFTPSVV